MSLAVSRRIREALREIQAGWSEEVRERAWNGQGRRRLSSVTVPPRKGRTRKGAR
jgi:hypothetical protein